jgi:hypothetical protein
MKPSLAPNKIAGWLYFVPALIVGGIWYIYLFVATPAHLTVWQSVVGQMQYTFSDENPQAWWFAWLIALPAACVVLGVLYLFNVASARPVRIGLFAFAIALAGATFVLNDWPVGVAVAIPAYWGYRAIHAT